MGVRCLGVGVRCLGGGSEVSGGGSVSGWVSRKQVSVWLSKKGEWERAGRGCAVKVRDAGLLQRAGSFD